MNISVPFLLGGFLVYLAIAAVIIILVVLVIRALLKYIRSGSVRKEKERVSRSLGEA